MIASIFRATSSLIGAVLLVAASGAMAERADNAKPMQIAADAMRYDDVKQTSVWTGNGMATKGTMVIKGEVCRVRGDAEGYQHGTVTGIAKKRAFFRQNRDSADEFMEGEGDTIEYDGKQDTIRLA